MEQVSAPKREVQPFLSKTAELVQDMVAVICLRPESEIAVDSLLEDLKMSVSYPIEPEQIVHGLNHLRRAGVISVDWHRRAIERLKTMNDYVEKYVTKAPLWPKISDNWRAIGSLIQTKYKAINPEFQKLLER